MKYILVKAFWKLFSHTPLSVMYILSDGLFFLFYHVIRYRRKITRKNLVESFPEKSLEEIVKTERAFYHFFLDVFMETCKVATISIEEIKRRMRFTNMDLLCQSLNNQVSVSLYLGHYGNWEWVSSFPLHMKGDIISGQIYQPLTNQEINRLMRENRSRFGAINIEKKETLRWINKQIKNNSTTIVGYIADQTPRARNLKHFLPFLNHEAPVLTGTETITKRYGMDAYYLEIKRPKRGYYEATFVKMDDDPKQLPDFRLTEIYYRYLENTIRSRPELYLWTHNRFRYAKYE
ncbi:MAG: lysophospholipid acyltransferase family protein [Dysgonamonadaceae bacterium]|jgi:KDO2-lipid IV(A) lauroyltransferase|nr:lysophospholipid acyltransferase family protein [Dysgonamonadaceae bacterium]